MKFSQHYRSRSAESEDRVLCPLYMTMNGPSEFHVIGKLKNWDITGRLSEIQLPTLITSGYYDEATPAIAKTVHQGIPNSRAVLFENSSHMPHVEEPELYMQTIDAFLSRVELTHTA